MNRRNLSLGKTHPLTTTWFLPKILFLWCNECINTCKKIPWRQEMNYNLPDYDKLSSHKPRLSANFKAKKNLLLAILLTYKKETLIIVVSQILLSFFKNYASKVVADSFESISVLPLYSNPQNLSKVATMLLGGALLKSIAVIASTNLLFYSKRISLGVRSSLFSMAQDKIMGFSTLNSGSEITQGFIADLIQVDIVYLNDLYFNIYVMFGSTVGMVTSLSFMFYFLGMSQTVIYIAVLGVLLTVYHACYALQAYFRKHYLEAKDKRMSLLRKR